MEVDFCQGARLLGPLPKVDAGGKAPKDAYRYIFSRYPGSSDLRHLPMLWLR